LVEHPEVCGGGNALSFGHRADGLSLIHSQDDEEPLAASGSPSWLAPEQFCERHSLELPAMAQDGFGRCQFADGDAPLDRSAGASNSVGALKCTQVLSAVNRAGRVIHGGFHTVAWSAMQGLTSMLPREAAAGAELHGRCSWPVHRPAAPSRIPGEVNRNSVKAEPTVPDPPRTAWDRNRAERADLRARALLCRLRMCEHSAPSNCGPRPCARRGLPKRTQKRGASWPGDDAALPAILAFLALASFFAVRALRDRQGAVAGARA
jgi:hypothetical protein